MTLVLVTVGTDHHPFDRLVRWAASWRRPDVDVLVQSGTSTPVDGLDCRPFLTVDELDDAVARAAAVVCHGGPGTIMQARHAGRLPIVVPRRPELGEHVDGHQVRFAAWMAERGQIVVPATETDLHDTLDTALADPDSFRLRAGDGGVEEASARFGRMVDELVRYRPR